MNIDRRQPAGALSMTLSRSVLHAGAGAALLVLPALCLAHAGTDAGTHHGAWAALAAGFLHPFSGLDHLAAMLALGVWSALTARRVWLAPLAFAATLGVGAAIGLTGIALSGVEPMIAASLLVLGLLLAGNARLPAFTGAAIAALFALFHGAAHGQELIRHDAPFAIAAMVAATALLHSAGIGMGLLLQRRSAWLPRVAGASVALFGVALLGQLA
jgi:urease accessory protein